MALDLNILKLSYPDPIHGAIKDSFVLSLDIPKVYVGGSDKNAGLQATMNIHPGNEMIIYDIKDGCITGLRIESQRYERVQPDKSHFLDVPAEVRQRIWKYFLATDNGSLAVYKQNNGKGIIIECHEGVHPPHNRIFEICKAFHNDAKFLECSVSHIWAAHTGGKLLLKLLHLSDSLPEKNLRNVTFASSWGPNPGPMDLS